MNWEASDGKLVRNIKCQDFKEALALLNKIAFIAESKEHHPDLLISKGVPVEVINESKNKMRAINSAWDQIQKLKSN